MFLAAMAAKAKKICKWVFIIFCRETNSKKTLLFFVTAWVIVTKSLIKFVLLIISKFSWAINKELIRGSQFGISHYKLWPCRRSQFVRNFCLSTICTFHCSCTPKWPERSFKKKKQIIKLEKKCDMVSKWHLGRRLLCSFSDDIKLFNSGWNLSSNFRSFLAAIISDS